MRCSTGHWPFWASNGTITPTSKGCGEIKRFMSKQGWFYPCMGMRKRWNVLPTRTQHSGSRAPAGAPSTPLTLYPVRIQKSVEALAIWWAPRIRLLKELRYFPSKRATCMKITTISRTYLIFLLKTFRNDNIEILLRIILMCIYLILLLGTIIQWSTTYFESK